MSEQERIRELLVSQELYLSAGVHVGTSIKYKDMMKFVYKVKDNGLAILDLNKIDERIRVLSRALARYNPDEVLAVTGRIYAFRPVKKFGEVTGIRTMIGRILPGTLTNPNSPSYCEPEVVFLSDPRVDRQIHEEAVKMGIPVFALCDTDTSIAYIDLVVPCNNKGRKSLALIYWIIARQMLREREEIGPEEDIGYKWEDFMTQIVGVE